MKKKISLCLTALCCVLLVTGSKVATAQEVKGYVVDSGCHIICYSMYTDCGPFESCVTSFKCATCSATEMKNRDLKGDCGACD